MARTAPPQQEQQAPPTFIVAPSPVAAWPSPLTDKKTTEQDEKKPRRTAGGGVPMGPALVGASNVTAMTVTGAFELAGPVGALAAGGAMAVGATAAALRRRSSVKRSMASRTGGRGALGNGGRGASGGGSGGGSGSGRGAFGGASRGAFGGVGTKSRGGSGGVLGGGSRGGSAGATKGAGKGTTGSASGGWGGSMAGATGRHKGKKDKRHGGSGGGQHRATDHRHGGNGTNRASTLKAAKDRTKRHGAGTGSKTGKALAALGNTAGAFGKGAKATGRGLKKTGGGLAKAWNSKAAAATRLGTRSALGAALDGGLATGAGALNFLRHRSLKGAWARLVDVWRRRRNKRKGKADAKAKADQTTPEQLADTARRPLSTTPIPATFGGTDMPGHHFVAPAMEMARIAANYNPNGMLEVGEDFIGLAEALRLNAEAMKITVENADAQYPLATQIIELMRQIHGLQIKAAELSDELKPAFESLHQVDLDRLRNPRKGKAGETMWDASTNL